MGRGWTAAVWLIAALAITGTISASAQAQAGGHLGVALPLANFSSDGTTTIADKTVIAVPIGVGIKLTDSLKFDFETVVVTTVKPTGSTGLIVDPGLVYVWGPVATGLRLAFKVGERANIGLIPLLNVPLVSLGKGTWFVEAAFPTFYEHSKVNLTTVLHTGVGF